MAKSEDDKKGEKATKLTNPQTACATAWMIRNWERFRATPATLEDYLAAMELGTKIPGLTNGKIYHISKSAELNLSEVILGKRGPKPLTTDSASVQFLAAQLRKVISKLNGINETWSDSEVQQLLDLATGELEGPPPSDDESSPEASAVAPKS